jgi:hypothetical protein
MLRSSTVGLAFQDFPRQSQERTLCAESRMQLRTELWLQTCTLYHVFAVYLK